MAGTVTIPLTTLPVGAHAFGPAAAADSDHGVLLTVDRTVTGGFNSQPASTTADYRADQSADGGVTWVLIAGGTMGGGTVAAVQPPRGPGGTMGTSTVSADMLPGTGRQVRAVVTVSGAPVAVAGTLTIT
jgi:hypothetical protein